MRPDLRLPPEEGTSLIAQMRRHRRLTQEELIARTGISRGRLQRLEQGPGSLNGNQKQAPSIRVLHLLAIALDCDVDDLVENEWRGWHPPQGGPPQPEPDPRWRPVKVVRHPNGAWVADADARFRDDASDE